MATHTRSRADLCSTPAMPAITADDLAKVRAILAARPARGHPTRRIDGRTPNSRVAESALAAAMNAPIEALELLEQTQSLAL